MLYDIPKDLRWVATCTLITVGLYTFAVIELKVPEARIIFGVPLTLSALGILSRPLARGILIITASILMLLLAVIIGHILLIMVALAAMFVTKIPAFQITYILRTAIPHQVIIPDIILYHGCIAFAAINGISVQSGFLIACAIVWLLFLAWASKRQRDLSSSRT